MLTRDATASKTMRLPDPDSIPGVVGHLPRAEGARLRKAQTRLLVTRILPKCGLMLGMTALLLIVILSAATRQPLLAIEATLHALAPMVPIITVVVVLAEILQARLVPSEPTKGRKRTYLRADGMVMLTMAERTRRGVTTWKGANHVKALGVPSHQTAAFRQDVFAALLAAASTGGVQKVEFAAAAPPLVDLYRHDLAAAQARLGAAAPALDVAVDWTPRWRRIVAAAARITIRPSRDM